MMNLTKGQTLFKELLETPNLSFMKLTIPNQVYIDQFKGSPSDFLKKLKNGLYSLAGKTNREFFRNLSGCYLCNVSISHTDIFLIMDDISHLSPLQVNIRIKKLIGTSSTLHDITKSSFELEVLNTPNLLMSIQCFGDWY
jgi:hypothetical protein